jgi:hypothetical protein
MVSRVGQARGQACPQQKAYLGSHDSGGILWSKVRKGRRKTDWRGGYRPQQEQRVERAAMGIFIVFFWTPGPRSAGSHNRRV